MWSEFENMVEYNASPLLVVFNSVVKYTNAPYSSLDLPIDADLRIKSHQQSLSNRE